MQRTTQVRRRPKRTLPPWIQELEARHKHVTHKQLSKIMHDMRARAQREMERIYK